MPEFGVAHLTFVTTQRRPVPGCSEAHGATAQHSQIFGKFYDENKEIERRSHSACRTVLRFLKGLIATSVFWPAPAQLEKCFLKMMPFRCSCWPTIPDILRTAVYVDAGGHGRGQISTPLVPVVCALFTWWYLQLQKCAAVLSQQEHILIREETSGIHIRPMDVSTAQFLWSSTRSEVNGKTKRTCDLADQDLPPLGKYLGSKSHSGIAVCASRAWSSRKSIPMTRRPSCVDYS